MKLGLVVDGDAESQALRSITRRLTIPGRHILDPIYANMQPKDSPKQIARSALAATELLLSRGVDSIVVLIDREDRCDCCEEFAAAIKGGFLDLGCPQVAVVVKNRRFENWLIADSGAFRQFRARYNVTAAFCKAAEPNKADHISDAEALINSIAIGRRYHKRRDAQALCAALSIDRAASNSRSLRRLLKVVGYPPYSRQSKRPLR